MARPAEVATGAGGLRRGGWKQGGSPEGTAHAKPPELWVRCPLHAQGKVLTRQKPWLPGEEAQVRHPDGAHRQDSPGDREELAAGMAAQGAGPQPGAC